MPRGTPGSSRASPTPAPDVLTLGSGVAITASQAVNFLSPAANGGIVNDGSITENGRFRITGNFTNAGTLNIVNASPAADVNPCLIAHEAVVELVSASGKRSMPLHDFLLGPGKTFCAHAPGAMEPLQSALKYFRAEFEATIAKPAQAAA